MEHITPGGLQRMFADVADAGTYGCFEYQGISGRLYSHDVELLDRFASSSAGCILHC